MSTPYSNCHIGGRLNLISFLQALLGVACCANLVSGQIPDLPGWDLVWNDEFSGTSLNTENWVALDRRDSPNNEKQYYHPNQVTVSGGNLQLTAINLPRDGKDFQSGLITSQSLFGPGRFEARIDLPTTQGMWPAFWLNANHIPWPQGGEIDIMENRGSQPNLVSSAYHWQTNPGPCCSQHQYFSDEYTAIEGGQPVNFHNSFHTYTAEWDETIIRYYVDGNLYQTITEAPDRPIFETAKNIIVNVAVGGNFGGDPNGSTVFPQTMLVDYVRYWQREDAPPEPGNNLLSNPGFDDSGGSLNGWSVFGNTIPNVLANDQLVNNGTRALKIFGQFNGPNNLSGASQGVAISEGDSLRALASTRSPSWDSLFGKSNDVTMKIEFYSIFGAAAGSSGFLGEVSQLIHDGSSAEDIWLDHTLEAIAPQDAVEARLSFVFRQPGTDNGAIWIDSTGLFLETFIDGDFDLDNDVDGADFLAWQRDNSVGSLADWQANYSTSATLSAVPEPASYMLALAIICLALGSRHR
ncbi:glycoside hydrolase family 16 protein [Bythopirellula polymerisocia]|uniref:Glucan endo-1,3-beta-glucosidase A1 n=1 Tax=Bythopirellula polymerisocia TaxID=2528003 RepID=A0A5C6CYU1_9BACT|nr:glycoside hydrolase family 16 protein [Bythopirellula polymerisocia]TWU29792.1 Glucan endo-1,3-beta-glucosidase A1 precursor [Bythopirellula polymerisocia]